MSPTQSSHAAGPATSGRHDRAGDHDARGDGDGAEAAGHDGPAQEQGRLELPRRAERDGDPDAERPVGPSPGGGVHEEQERAQLAELHGVEEGPGQSGQEDDRPADLAADRKEGDAGEEREDEHHGPGERRGQRGHRCGEREDRKDERGRVVEEAIRPRSRERKVVQRSAGQQAPRGAVVHQVVVAERIAGREQDQRRPSRSARRSPAPAGRPGASRRTSTPGTGPLIARYLPEERGNASRWGSSCARTRSCGHHASIRLPGGRRPAPGDHEHREPSMERHWLVELDRRVPRAYGL